MPRLARLDSPGTLHHVMIRGIERGEIVEGVKDRKAFIERMGALAVETGTKIYSTLFVPSWYPLWHGWIITHGVVTAPFWG